MRNPFAFPLTFAALALALAGCGGNYSNDDVLFRNAVPTRDLLSSKLSASSAALRSMPGRSASVGGAHFPGTATAVGDASGLAQLTLGASDGFNAGLFKILDVLQAVISIEPSVRKPDERIWGPYPDGQHKGFEVQLVMDRVDARFDYHVDVRKTGTEDWTQVIQGDFQATGDLRKGEGALHFLDAAARAVGYDPLPSDVTSIDATYQTQEDPLTVTLVVMNGSDPDPLLAFSYAGWADGGGQMRFDVSAQLVGGSTSPLETLDILSRWTAAGAGRADVEIIAGDFTGTSYVECWSAADTLLYSAATWATPVGTEASCPAF